jgi:hypothetical protein
MHAFVRARFAALGLAALSALVALAAGAAALPVAAAQTQTVRIEPTTESFPLAPFPDPVCGIPGDSLVTIVYTGVLHETLGPDGRSHTSSAIHGDTTIAVPGGPTYAGHFADQGTDNLNLRNQTHAFTSNNLLRAPDGSLLNLHVVFHLIVSASGGVQVRFTFGCGGG